MNKIVENFQRLVDADISVFSKEEKIAYYENIRKKLDKIMDESDIDLDLFEELLEIKKQVLAKVNNLIR